MDEAEFQALYGRWEPLTPHQVRDLFADAPFRWWIAGGHALELGGAASRPHDDVDVAVLFDDLPALREWLRDYHLWEAHSGGLRPLLAGEDLQPEREQLWLRRDANHPWLADIVLTPSEDGSWLFKKDRRISLPLDEVGSTTDGVSFLKPHVALLHKAHLTRDKDAADFDAVLPHLEHAARRWLDDALALYKPEHPWRERLR
jgi:hypothetical protein